MRFISTLCLLTILSTAALAADGRRTTLKLVGLYNFTMPKSDDAATQALLANRGDIGGGAFLEFPLGKVVGFEVGGVYQPYGYKTVDATIDTDILQQWHYISIPATLKFHLGNVVSFGLGGFYNVAMGKIKTTGTVLSVAVDSEDDLADAAKSDYGAHATLGFEFSLGKTISFLLEGRGLMGLKNLSSTSTTFKAIQLQGLGGFGIKF